MLATFRITLHNDELKKNRQKTTINYNLYYFIDNKNIYTVNSLKGNRVITHRKIHLLLSKRCVLAY